MSKPDTRLKALIFALKVAEKAMSQDADQSLDPIEVSKDLKAALRVVRAALKKEAKS